MNGVILNTAVILNSSIGALGFSRSRKAALGWEGGGRATTNGFEGLVEGMYAWVIAAACAVLTAVYSLQQ